MATMDQRVLNVESEVNQLKGAYDHLATKADLERIKGDLERAKWQIGGLVVGSVSVATAILATVIRISI